VAIGIGINNPGDLLYGTPWQGVTGSQSGNGLNYAVFDSPADGWRALTVDLSSAISHGYNTLSALVYHFLGTSTNNAANPAVANYLSTVERVTGLSANSPLSTDPGTLNALATGFSTAEGTISGFGQFASGGGASAVGVGGSVSTNPFDPANMFNPSNTITGAAGVWSWITGSNVPNPVNPSQIITPSMVGAAAAQIPGQAASAATTGVLNALGGPTVLPRLTIGVVAILLLAAGIFMLAGGPKVVIDAARAVPA
jgi:hypothetical protein